MILMLFNDANAICTTWPKVFVYIQSHPNVVLLQTRATKTEERIVYGDFVSCRITNPLHWN